MNPKPDYMNIVNAAKNMKPDRIPLYEHLISTKVMETITGKAFAHFAQGDYADKLEFFGNYSGFQRDMGYDAVSYECCVGKVMPGSGALGNPTADGVIKTREDFEAYPWGDIPGLYFEKFADSFQALRQTMPDGMKAIGGVGNGVFECVQDVVGFQELCYIKADDEELYRDLFAKAGDMLCSIWERFLVEFGDIYCVCRFGDDLGYRSSTLLSKDDIEELIIPQYKRVIEMIHRHGKPFLLHSCGNIFGIMDSLIEEARIDAKHSNEDAIAPFSQWIDDYGARIGIFGGIDTDVLCALSSVDIKRYVTGIYNKCIEKGCGAAIGSGNSIPDYVDTGRYLLAVKTVRELRGD